MAHPVLLAPLPRLQSVHIADKHWLDRFSLVNRHAEVGQPPVAKPFRNQMERR